MTVPEDGGVSGSPDAAFAALGNETRIAILRALGEAGEPLSFSELYDRLDVEDSGGFNYHLEKLVGNFVEKTEAGYALARPGRRIVEAVQSGAVTATPTAERTELDQPCPRCGAPVEVRWRSGSVEKFCTECDGTYARSRADPADDETPGGYLGRYPLPPAGLQGRDPADQLRAAWTWSHTEFLSMASGLCPRCSATVEYTLYVCDDHDSGERRCPACANRYAVNIGISCTNCIFDAGGSFVLKLVGETAMLDFLTDHGCNPVDPGSAHVIEAVHEDYEETLLSTEPFRARFTFELAGDRLALTVDDDLEVVEVERSGGEAPANGPDVEYP